MFKNRYDRLKVYKDDLFHAYLKPKDIEDLQLKGEYRKRINPADGQTVEKIFVLEPEK